MTQATYSIIGIIIVHHQNMIQATYSIIGIIIVGRLPEKFG
jgi:hypothetical protein